VVHANIDGTGFPLAYLFLENNGNCGNGIRTATLIDFFLELKTRGLEPEFFLTDKDFAQISAARFIWKNIKIQLCLWHIKKAVETKLSNNKKPQQINYNGVAAQQQFSFIDHSFKPTLNKDKRITSINMGINEKASSPTSTYSNRKPICFFNFNMDNSCTRNI
jgi:hypothetical protein